MGLLGTEQYLLKVGQFFQPLPNQHVIFNTVIIGRCQAPFRRGIALVFFLHVHSSCNFETEPQAHRFPFPDNARSRKTELHNARTKLKETVKTWVDNKLYKHSSKAEFITSLKETLTYSDDDISKKTTASILLVKKLTTTGINKFKVK